MSSLPEGFSYGKLKDRSYRGDDFKVNKKLSAGPFSERRCTDVLCCLLFVVALGGMVTCAYYGIANGKPRNLIAPIDGDRNICGVTPGYEDYKYLFIGDISQGEKNLDNIFDYGICVQACPKSAEEAKALKCKVTEKVPSCNMS